MGAFLSPLKQEDCKDNASMDESMPPMLHSSMLGNSPSGGGGRLGFYCAACVL